MNSNIPEVIASGVLESFNDLPCYVLEDGQRIFRLSHLTKALTNKEHGKFGNYLATSNINKYLPENLKPLNDKYHDRVPQGIVKFKFKSADKVEKGYNSEDFMDVCAAFATANLRGEILSDAQKEIVINVNKYILASSKVGITALIDEATGYQAQRDHNELQLRMSFYLAEKEREWEKTFPDQLWMEFGRLTNWSGSIKQRPKYWGKLVNEFVYDCIDEDLVTYLKENKPLKPSNTRYHQWLNEDRGVKALIQHIWQVIGMSKTCNSIQELRRLINKEFKGVNQLSLF